MRYYLNSNTCSNTQQVIISLLLIVFCCCTKQYVPTLSVHIDLWMSSSR